MPTGNGRRYSRRRIERLPGHGRTPRSPHPVSHALDKWLSCIPCDSLHGSESLDRRSVTWLGPDRARRLWGPTYPHCRTPQIFRSDFRSEGIVANIGRTWGKKREIRLVSPSPYAESISKVRAILSSQLRNAVALSRTCPSLVSLCSGWIHCWRLVQCVGVCPM